MESFLRRNTGSERDQVAALLFIGVKFEV